MPLENFSRRIAGLLYSQGVIKEQDIDKCRYGLEVFMSSSAEVLSILVLSLFPGNFAETCLFFAAFIPLRIYAGGYHADTRLRCYFVSLAIYALFSAAIAFLPQSFYLPAAIAEAVISFAAVYIFSPVVHFRRKMNSIEIKNYRRFSLAICAAESILILIFTAVFKGDRFTASAAFGQLAEALSIAAALIKEKIKS